MFISIFLMSRRCPLLATHLIFGLLNNQSEISVVVLLTLNTSLLWLMWLKRKRLCNLMRINLWNLVEASVAFFQKVVFVKYVTPDMYSWLFHLQYHVPTTRRQTVEALAQNSIVLSSLTLSLTGNILRHIKDSLKRSYTRCATVDCEHFMPSSQKRKNFSSVNMISKHILSQHMMCCLSMSVS